MVANIDRKKYYPIVIFYDDHIIARKLRELEVETHSVDYNVVLREF